MPGQLLTASAAAATLLVLAGAAEGSTSRLEGVIARVSPDGRTITLVPERWNWSPGERLTVAAAADVTTGWAGRWPRRVHEGEGVMAERFLVVMQGGIEPKLIGPIPDTDPATERALIGELKQNAALLAGDGGDSHFVLRVMSARGHTRLSPIAHAGWSVDACRARAHLELGQDAEAEAILATLAEVVPEIATRAEAIVRG